MFVSVQWTLQYSNEIRGTSRTVLLPSRSYHRCPCSDLRPSQPVSAQLLSEVLQHVRYFPIGSHGLPVSVASKLSGLSSFQGLYSLPYLQIKSWSPDMCHIKSLRTKEIFFFLPLAYSLHSLPPVQPYPHHWNVHLYFLLRKPQFTSHSANTRWKESSACFSADSTRVAGNNLTLTTMLRS